MELINFRTFAKPVSMIDSHKKMHICSDRQSQKDAYDIMKVDCFNRNLDKRRRFATL